MITTGNLNFIMYQLSFRFLSYILHLTCKRHMASWIVRSAMTVLMEVPHNKVRDKHRSVLMNTNIYLRKTAPDTSAIPISMHTHTYTQ